jgi:hypothetical protein
LNTKIKNEQALKLDQLKHDRGITIEIAKPQNKNIKPNTPKTVDKINKGDKVSTETKLEKSAKLDDANSLKRPARNVPITNYKEDEEKKSKLAASNLKATSNPIKPQGNAKNSPLFDLNKIQDKNDEHLAGQHLSSRLIIEKTENPSKNQERIKEIKPSNVEDDSGPSWASIPLPLE